MFTRKRCNPLFCQLLIVIFNNLVSRNSSFPLVQRKHEPGLTPPSLPPPPHTHAHTPPAPIPNPNNYSH